MLIIWHFSAMHAVNLFSLSLNSPFGNIGSSVVQTDFRLNDGTILNLTYE